MNCMNHQDKSAIGICKSCCKGLCAECVTALPDGISCRNDVCEKRVTTMFQMVDISIKNLTNVNAHQRSAYIFMLIFGSAFLLFSFLPISSPGDFGFLFTIVFAIIFIAFGVIGLMRRSRYFQTPKR